MSLEVVTLGCRLNAVESAAMKALAAGEKDLVIVNSCAVTNEAVSQTRQAIRRAKRLRPGARVIVTGCAAQVEPETFAAMPEVSRVVGNGEKLLSQSYRPSPLVRNERDYPFPFVPSKVEGRGHGREEPLDFAPDERGWADRVQVSDIFSPRETAPHLATGLTHRARAFVAVQTGCDHRCTFCIIPFGRGNSRSVPAGLVVDRVKALAEQGYREIVLTGVDITSYGPDLPGAPTLGSLVERILRHVPDLPRLRLSSLDCIEMDERLFDLVTGDERVMPHLHLSLQAGDDMVLKRMKRRHSRAQAIALVERLKARRPEIAIGADLIAGFPTETDAMAENSLKLIDDCDIVMGHIFPYSPRRGTPAARMPQVPGAAIRERAARLRAATARRKSTWLQELVGTRQRVLVEAESGFGHAENFAAARVCPSPSASPFRRQIAEVRITALEGETLIGVPA